MEFNCRLGTHTGEILEGVYVADSEAQLRQEFENKGLHVLFLERSGSLGWLSLSLPKLRRLGTQEFVIFNQELAALLRAGMPLVQSLNILRQRTENPTFKSILDDVHERVRSGSALSEAFEAHRPMVPGVYTASLMAGEKSGSLDDVLRRYVSHTRIISSVKRKTVSALIYPAILLALSLLVVAIIVFRVVPEFGEFYAGVGADLPFVTRAIMLASTTLRSYFSLIFFSLLMGSAVFWIWLKQPGRRMLIDQLLLRIPGVGTIAEKFSTSQLARTLATLLGGGVPIVSALDVASRAVGNRYFTRQIGIIAQDVREGQALSASMSVRKTFPPVAIQMIEVGESTGSMQDMLNNVADFFDEEIETALARFIALIEPVLLLIIGIVIAGLLLALYMPLLQLGTVLQ